MLLQIAFVIFVIFITHKIYEAFFGGANNKRRKPATASSSGTTGQARTQPTAPPAETASGTKSQGASGGGRPSHDPPAYESLYPNLEEIKAAQRSAENPGILSWFFGSGSSGASSSDSFQKIVDRFHNLDEVTDAIRNAGLESSNLLFGKWMMSNC